MTLDSAPLKNFFPESDERRVLVVCVFSRGRVVRPGQIRCASGSHPTYRFYRIPIEFLSSLWNSYRISIEWEASGVLRDVLKDVLRDVLRDVHMDVHMDVYMYIQNMRVTKFGPNFEVLFSRIRFLRQDRGL